MFILHIITVGKIYTHKTMKVYNIVLMMFKEVFGIVI